MKEIKKETKIVIGISITVILLAIIATVVVLAVKSAKRGTQLFGNEYVWVENDRGVVTMRDGLFVAAVDGGYVLVREDKILSKKYADLRLVDEEKKLYEFATFDGYYGRMDENGDEISGSVVKANGNFIGDTAQYTDFEFCKYYDGGAEYARLGGGKSKSDAPALESKRYDAIYKHGEIGAFMSEKGDVGSFENVLPSGVFLAKNLGKYFIASVYGESYEIDLTDVSVEKLCYDFITVRDAEGSKTYRLPDFERVSALEGIAGGNILSKDGAIFYLDGGLVKRAGGDTEFSVSFVPDKIAASVGDGVLMTRGGKGVYCNGATVKEGDFEDFGVLYRVGDALIYADELVVASVAEDTLMRIDADGKIFFFMGEPVGGTRALYEFKNGALELKSDAAYTTYGDPAFENKRYKGEYETYFMYGGKTYDTDFAVVGEGIIVRENLLRNGTDYTDIKGGNKIESAGSFYDVYDYEGNSINEYLFEKGAEYFLSTDVKTPIELDSDIRRVVKAENGVYVFFVEGGLQCTGVEETFYSEDCNEYVLMDNSNIALITDSRVRIVKPTKRGFEEVASYGFFGASLDGSYKNANSASGNVVFGKTCQKGVVFRVSSGKVGFVNADGRLALSPVYDAIRLTQHYALVRNGGNTTAYARYAVADFRGRMITDFEYTSVMYLGSFVIGLKSDGSAEIVNARGNNVAKNVVFGDYLSVKNYVTRNGDYFLDEDVRYIFVNVNGKYRLVCVYS